MDWSHFIKYSYVEQNRWCHRGNLRGGLVERYMQSQNQGIPTLLSGTGMTTSFAPPAAKLALGKRRSHLGSPMECSMQRLTHSLKNLNLKPVACNLLQIKNIFSLRICLYKTDTIWKYYCMYNKLRLDNKWKTKFNPLQCELKNMLLVLNNQYNAWAKLSCCIDYWAHVTYFFLHIERVVFLFY